MSNGINVLDAENKLQEKISDIFDWNEYKINNNKTLRAAQNMTNSLSKRNINGHTRILSYVIQKLYSMKTVKSEKLNNNLTQDVIYLNCSTYNVNCSTIYCDLSALKRQQDVGKLVIKLILNVTKLRGIDQDKNYIVLYNINYIHMYIYIFKFVYIIILRYYRDIGSSEDC